MLDRFFNLSMRSVTLVGKLFLVLVLARFLEPEEVGLYGLLAATISYLLFLVGLDFYTFTQREIFKFDRKDWALLIKAQTRLSLILYIACMPILISLFHWQLLPWSLALWFMPLLIVEHLCQELSRFLTAISQPVQSGLVIFFRHGIWAIAVPLCFWLSPATRSLNFVFSAWLVSGLVGISFGVLTLKKAQILRWTKEAVDWRWVRKGLKVALPLLASTLALRAMNTMDRYWFEALNDKSVLGAYVLFIGLGNALQSFMDAGVYSFRYPKLIESWQNKDPLNFTATIRKLFFETSIYCVGFVLAAAIFTKAILSFIGREIYQQHLGLFYWLLAGTVVFVFSMIPHFALYAQGRDKTLILSHFLALVGFIVVVAGYSMIDGLLAVPIGVCAASGIILILKTTAFLKLTPRDYRW